MKNRRWYATAVTAVLFGCFVSAALSACGDNVNSDDMWGSGTYRPLLSEESTDNKTESVSGEGTAPPAGSVSAGVGESATGGTQNGSDSNTNDNTYTSDAGTDITEPSVSMPSDPPDVSAPGGNTSGTTQSDPETVPGTAPSDTVPDTSAPGTVPGTTTENPPSSATPPSGTHEQETTTPDIESSEVSQVENPLKPVDHSIEFFFKVPGYTGSSYYELYLNDGFVPVENLSQLREYCRNELLTLAKGNKSVNYIITPGGMFDGLAADMAGLDAKASSSGKIKDIYARDAYLYESLGLDYQSYYSRGLSIFKIKKMGDVGSGKHSVYAIYYYSYETAEQTAEVENVVDRVVSGFFGGSYDKILAAYDYLCDVTVYSDDAESYEAHSAYGALLSGSAVCEGYAKAYKLLLDKMNIPNYIVINMSHAWNVVMCDDEWYFVDVTNGDFNNCYAYFMLGADVLCNPVDMTIDYFVFPSEIIAYYGYADGENTDRNKLAAKSVSERVIVYR